jgi:hypothetical protein
MSPEAQVLKPGPQLVALRGDWITGLTCQWLNLPASS